MAEDRNPFGLHTITPYLVVESVSTLIQFLQQVFDAESRGDPRYREDGSVKHAEVRIGDSEHLIDRAPLIGDSLQRDHLHAVDHTRISLAIVCTRGTGTMNVPPASR